MKTVACASCGAPFEDVPGDEAVRCGFCGAINERTMIRRPPPPPPPPAPPMFKVPAVDYQVIINSAPVRAAGTAVAFSTVVAMVGVVLGIGAAIFGVWTAVRVSSRHGDMPRIPFPSLPLERRYTLATLPQFHEFGRKVLDVEAPAGGFTSVDAVTALPWATKIAQAWSPDARLDRLDVSRVRPDGTVDAAADADAEVMYRFVSPSRIAQYWHDADTVAKPKAECEFWVIAKKGQSLVQLISSRPSRSDAPAAPAPQVLPLTQILTKSRARLPQRPFYNGYMIHSGRDGWVWYLSTLSGRDNVPRVRARDGRAWPW